MAEKIATAQWIDPESIATDFPYEEGKFWLGRTIDREAKPIGFGDDRHVLIVGGTRGGKGTTFLVNNLCHWPGSAIVVDPKGENATVTAERRGKGNKLCNGLGQAVHVLDPYSVAKVPDSCRSKFNPLDWLDGADDLCTKKAERLATSLVPFKTKSEEYWDNESRSLIGALLVHIATYSMYEGKRNLLTLRDLIMRGDVGAVEYLEAGTGEPAEITPLQMLWQSMKDNPVCDGYVRDSGTYFSDMVETSEKQWAGIRAGVKTATDFLTSKGMRDLVETSDFSISDVKSDPNGQTIYLSIPQDFINSDCGWLRMMIDMVSTEAKLISGKPATGHPILLMLDEFAGLRRMDVLEKSIAQIAGYGVKMVCVVQELGQLEDVYGKNWETFISGSGVRIFFANGDARTKEYVSKMAGDAEIVRDLQSKGETKGQTFQKQVGESTSTSSNRGSGWGLNGNYGRHHGANYEPGGLMTLFPSKTGTSGGGGGGLGLGYNRNKGTTEGQSNSSSETEGWSTGQSSGVSESIHKRRLIEPHDVEKLLARIENKNDPRYPGVALAMIAGYPPMPIRKCNYFEDPAFYRCFTPHPDHEFSPLLPEERKTPFKYLGAVPPPDEVVVFNRPNNTLQSWIFADREDNPVSFEALVHPGDEIKEHDGVISANGLNAGFISPVGGIVHDTYSDNVDEFQSPIVSLELSPCEDETKCEIEDLSIQIWLMNLKQEQRKLILKWVLSSVGFLVASFMILASGSMLLMGLVGIFLVFYCWEIVKDEESRTEVAYMVRNLFKACSNNLTADDLPPMTELSPPLSGAPSHYKALEREEAEERRERWRFDEAHSKWRRIKSSRPKVVEEEIIEAEIV